MSAPIVYATRAYAPQARALCDAGGFRRGQEEISHFPDGELYLRLATPPDGCDAVLVGGTISDSDTLELYDLACGLVEEGARSLVLIVPYFGHSTMERAVKPGEVVTAKTRARLLSSIPTARFGNRVLLVDLHSEGLPYYFEGAMRAVHVYAKPVVIEAMRALGGDDFVVACTDAGRAKWVESLANDLGIEASFVFKKRLSGDRTEVTAVSAHVEGRRVVIYDDMIRTGSSLIGAARAYLDAGASSVVAVATHGVFPDGALEKLTRSGVIEKLACTDTHPRALELAGPDLQVFSVAPLLATYLKEHAAQGE